MFGVNLEGRLKFDFHVNTLLKEAGKKYHTLARVCNYMNTKKRRILMNSFITSQFSCCPLLLMSIAELCAINKNNEIHGIAFGFVYKNKTILLFDNLLKKHISVSFHQRNLHILTTKIYKVRSNLVPQIMKNLFHFLQKPYYIRNVLTLQKQRKCKVYFGTKSISSFSPKHQK